MTAEKLKAVVEARMRSVQILLGSDDWFLAASTMALALECALKVMICKTLNLSAYPAETTKQIPQRVRTFFWTHEFSQLLILSGLNESFSPAGTSPELFQNWSDFTKEFPGSWADTKYDYERQQQFDEAKVKRLHVTLTDPAWGVLTKIKEKW